MVASGPKRHFATINYRIAKGSFDYVGGGGEQRPGYGEAQRLGGFEIDEKLGLGRRMHGKVSDLLALEDAITH